MITQSQIEEIVQILVDAGAPEKILLFGSYARGDATETSDLDLAIITRTDLPKAKRPASFQKALRANGKKWFFPMDILVYTPEEVEIWKQNPYSLISEIVRTGKTLYESAQSDRLVSEGKPGSGTG